MEVTGVPTVSTILHFLELGKRLSGRGLGGFFHVCILYFNPQSDTIYANGDQRTQPSLALLGFYIPLKKVATWEQVSGLFSCLNYFNLLSLSTATE